MKKEKAIAQNREALKQLLLNKSALKQDIADDCEKVFEFCDPRIQEIQTMTEHLLNFKVTHHSLNFFGKCSKLAANGKCEHLKNNLS